MDQWVLEATTAALDRMIGHAKLVDLSNTDEFTFRAFSMAALRQKHAACRIQSEWNFCDLLTQLDGQNVLIEFKYDILRRTVSLDGRPGNWKGGAGKKNEREFWDCVRKLNACVDQPIDARYLVLVYQRQETLGLRKTFEASFGKLAAGDLLVEGVVAIERAPLICRVLRIHRPPRSAGNEWDLSSTRKPAFR